MHSINKLNGNKRDASTCFCLKVPLAFNIVQKSALRWILFINILHEHTQEKEKNMREREKCERGREKNTREKERDKPLYCLIYTV